MHLAAAVRWERADDLKEVMNFNAQGSEHRKLSSGESRYFLPWKQVSADGQQYPTGHTPSTLSTAARRLSRLVINGAEMVAQEPRDPNRYFRRPAVQCPDLGGGEQGAAIIITEVTLQLERPSSNHLAGWQCSCHCQQRPSSWGLSCSPSCLPAPTRVGGLLMKTHRCLQSLGIDVDLGVFISSSSHRSADGRSLGWQPAGEWQGGC